MWENATDGRVVVLSNMPQRVQQREKARPFFNSKGLLDKIWSGRATVTYAKDQVVFSQGDRADSVFHLHKGKLKLTVVSEPGKRGSYRSFNRRRFLR